MKSSKKKPRRSGDYQASPRSKQGAQPHRSTKRHDGSSRSRSARAPKLSSAPKLRAHYTDPPVESAWRAQPRLIERTQHLLILDKPAGWLTHSDGTARDQGGRPDLVSWAQDRFQCRLRVHQRLDVSTSGVIAFSLDEAGDVLIQRALKYPNAKQYLAVVEGAPSPVAGTVRAPAPRQPQAPAESDYRTLKRGPGWSLLEVTPKTGRTHQIRAHCAHLRAPIRGDALYGDPLDLRAPRALLHAHRLTIDGITYRASPPDCFARYLTDELSGDSNPLELALRLRGSLTDAGDEECYRVLHGDVVGWEGYRIDRYQDWLWIIQNQGQRAQDLTPLLDHFKPQGIYRLEALVDRSRGAQPTPALISGAPAPTPLAVWEAGVRYAVELGTHLSTGLFLDQRPQREWLAHSARPWGRVLNTFAHAGGFSVAAAHAGAETVSIDLSGQWLNRIPAQLELNELNPAPHRLLTGDVFDWLRRLAKRGERFDLIILDPPSTSVGTKRKRWSAAKDYPALIELTLPLLAAGGRILTATNHRKLTPHRFAHLVASALPQGFTLERVCAPGVDYPTDAPLAVKNLIWRAPH